MGEGEGRVYNTHRNLKDPVHARASRLDNGLDVLAAETGLLGDGTLNQDAVLGEGDLTGEEDLAVDRDGLGILSWLVFGYCYCCCGGIGGIGGWWGEGEGWRGWISLT